MKENEDGRMRGSRRNGMQGKKSAPENMGGEWKDEGLKPSYS